MPVNVFAADLASTRYSTGAVAFLETWYASGSRAQTGVYPDGDFTKAEPHGNSTIEFPFADHGDSVTIIVRQRFWQFATDFRPTALGTPAPQLPDKLLLDEENFHDEGGGIVAWDQVYCSLPQSHDEFADFPYQAQYLYSSGGSVRLAEQTFTVASRVRCEYFHVKDLGTWDIKLALRVVQLTDTFYTKRGVGDLYLSGNILVSTDKQIVAEDSKLRIWRWPFMERRTRYVAGPTAEFWGESITL